MGIKDTFKRIFIGAAPSDENTEYRPESPSGGEMTRQEFEDQVVNHFILWLNKLTTKGSLLYPTNFYIYLTPVDYEEQKESFPYTVKDIVNEFNSIISKRKASYPGFEPISTYWQFQFLKFDEGTMVESVRSTFSDLEDGNVLILTTLFSKEHLSPDSPEIAAEENVRVVTTRRSKSTVKTHQLSINMAALRGLMMESEDRFKVRCMSFGTVSDDSVTRDVPKELATVKIAPFSDSVCFLVNGTPAEKCNMLRDILLIAGKNAVDTPGAQTLKVSSDSVLNPHIRIERTPDGFFLQANGDIILNEVPMQKGERTALPSNSSIMLNSSIQITFKTA